MAAPPLPPVPIDIDPMTISDDPHFIDRIRAARNLPDDIRAGLAQFCRVGPVLLSGTPNLPDAQQRETTRGVSRMKNGLSQ
jgi:hypothetical protein